MMKKIILAILIVAIYPAAVFSQALTQTVRGTVIDADSKMPLVGAQIIILDSTPLKGTTSNRDGEFRLENIPIGRIALQISYIGFESILIPDVIVKSGKEVYLDLSMRESIVAMDELTVTPDAPKGIAMNDMALISSRSISPEETSRYPGGFDDPARILSNFAGVTNSQTGVADIIVRGNSPKYVQWGLEGVPITNPNHFADHNGSGVLNSLNNNLLATSDFYTGAFSPEYGNVLSGVYDVKFRRGNNEKFESTFGFGLMGTDLTIEGPFKKDYDGSYLVNYRYSTITMVSKVGLIPDIGGIPKFQDASFKISLPTKKAGTFSLFGLSGLGSFEFEDVTPDFWETPGERGMNEEITEDYKKKKTHLLNTGINHTLTLNNNSYIRTTLAYSNEGITDEIFELPTSEADNGNRDNRELNYNSDILKSIYRASLSYNNKLNAKNNLQVGSRFALFDYKNMQSNLQHDSGNRFSLADFHENMNTITNYVGWQHRLSKNLTIVSGLHNMNVLLNNKSTLEPRIALNLHVSSSSSFHAGYGNHSTMEGVHHYFAKVEQENESIVEPNRDLGLLKAHHYVVGYKTQFEKNMRVKVELYYQDLYDLPVENSTTSNFATINEGAEFRNVDLVNEGTGKNYGVEITLERFANSYYFMVNGSLYSSKYTALDGVERNTMYNGDYLLNILAGKEFVNLGSKKDQTLSLNAKAFLGGGKKIIPLLRDTQGNLAVDTENNRYFDYSKAYENSLDDIFDLTLSASYKWNKPAATHELYLNIDNITNSQSRLNEFYDENEPNSIGYMVQSFFYPNLMYKVYF